MADGNIIKKLTKKVTSNKSANEQLLKNFSKLAKSKPPVNTEIITNLYNNLFYNIPKFGNLSHETIFNQSYNFRKHNTIKYLETQIDNSISDLEELNNKLTELEIGDVNENSVYEDGAILQLGENGGPYQVQEGARIKKWVMQEGLKREITNDDIYTAIRRGLDLPENPAIGVYYLTELELENIDSGLPIATFPDLNITGYNNLFIGYQDIEVSSAFYELEIICDGNEISDSSNMVLDDDVAAQGQWVLGNAGCSLKLIVDEGTPDEIEAEIVNLNLNRGEIITVKFVRDTGMLNSAIPTNIDALHMENTPGEVIYTSSPGGPEFTVFNYIREWGSGRKYSGIIHASGRLRYKELQPTLNSNWSILNGLPTEGAGYWQLVDINDTIQTSDYGTKRIFAPGTTMWGALNQNNELQEHFNNMDYNYYRYNIQVSELEADLSYLGSATTALIGDHVNVPGSNFTFPIYGQPIIRYNNTFNVVLKIWQKSWEITAFGVTILTVAEQEWFWLYDLQTGDVYSKRRKSLKDASINLDMEFFQDGDIRNIKWASCNTNQVRYIGHAGVGVVGYNSTGIGNDNPFNPGAFGSNYSINNYNNFS